MARADFYSSRIGNDVAVIKAGFRKLSEEAGLASSREVWLVTNTKGNLDGCISDAIGQNATSALLGGKGVPLGSGPILRLHTERTLPLVGRGPILACFPTRNLLTKLDGLHGIPALIVLPWTLEDISDWVDTHAPTDIFGAVRPKAIAVANPVVEAALESIWGRINVGTGIAHPLDKHTVIETFRILKKASEAYSAAEVRAWLIRRGMQPKSADEIAAIADNPSKFRSNARSGSAWRTDILDVWRGNAE